MKYTFKIFSLVILSLYISCKENKKDNNIQEKKTISLFYLTGKIETVSKLTCDYFYNNAEIKKESADTIIISLKDFKRIDFFLNNSKLMNKKSDCDIRMMLKFENNKICIGELNCTNNNYGQTLQTDLSNIYLIKKLSGYFNYFSEEELQNDETIKRYGVPDNYNYLKNLSSLERQEGLKIVFTYN